MLLGFWILDECSKEREELHNTTMTLFNVLRSASIFKPQTFAFFFFGNFLDYMRLVVQLCLTLCDPLDCSLSDSSVHEIFQTRILECVAISFSRGSSQPKDQVFVPCISCIGRRVLNPWTPGKPPALLFESNVCCTLHLHVRFTWGTWKSWGR